MKTLRTSLRNSILENNQIKTGVYSTNSNITDLQKDAAGNLLISNDNGKTFTPAVNDYLNKNSPSYQTVNGRVQFKNGIISTVDVVSSGRILNGTRGGLNSDNKDSVLVGDIRTPTVIQSAERLEVNEAGTTKKVAYTNDNLSQFAQDATHRTVTDSEKATWNGKATVSELIDLIFPINSIYPDIRGVNPGTFLGGTWEIWLQGEYLLCSTSTISEAGKTSGSNSITLTAANLPSHNHTFTPSGSLSTIGDSFLQGYFVSGQTQPKVTGNTGAGGFAVSAPATQYSGQKQQDGYAMDILHLQAHTHSFTGSAGTTSTVGSGTPITLNPLKAKLIIWKRVD